MVIGVRFVGSDGCVSVFFAESDCGQNGNSGLQTECAVESQYVETQRKSDFK